MDAKSVTLKVEGYRIIRKESGTRSTAEKLFDDDVTFTDTPAKYARSIQVAIFTNSSSVLSILLNDTAYALNNGADTQGAITFTLLVESTDTLNITTGSTTVPLSVVIAGAESDYA